MRRGLRRTLIVVPASLAGLILVAALAAILTLRGSLPRLDGEKTLPGLEGRVEVTRDALGVPDIRADSWLDAARALGYLHAQERFFQMDLQRRSAAGELSALLGPQLATADRGVRIHRFRSRAVEVVAAAGPRDTALLDAYTGGVNAGLDDLGVRPFEYLVLRRQPEPWKPEDTVLTLYAMFLDLSLSTAYTERASSMVAGALPAALADYLLTPAARWDAPLQEGPPWPAPIPDSSEVDLRRWVAGTGGGGGDAGGGGEPAVPDAPEGGERPGSNNWAVAGRLTRDGRALLANDMHLSHGIPNIWYRARIGWSEEGAQPGERVGRSMVGVTLPGTPAMVAGSNGRVAWGFTNSYIDCADLVRLELDPADSTRYMTPDGWERIRSIEEVIEVAGSAPDTLTVRETRWGPVWTEDLEGSPLALRWTAHDVEAVNLALIGMSRAGDVDEAVLAAASAGMPPQNLVCADSAGDIAWTIAGRVPKRTGWDGRLPVSWADGTCRWDGYLEPEDQPKIMRPEEGRLWTANNRVVGGHFYSVLGDGGYGLGARARQIRGDLRSVEEPNEFDMLFFQIDDDALFLEEWRALALEALEGDTTASRATFARLVRDDWSGRASIESAGYRLVAAFTDRLVNIVYKSLTAPVRTRNGEFRGYWLSYRHSVTWELLQERPAHMLLPVYHSSWDEVILEAVDETMELATAGGRPASEWTWGARNVVDVAHPFTRLIPQLRRWLAAPLEPLPGDSHMPRVQSPRFGASERLVVSPGREEDGFFNMPGGQSGHPLSKYFLAGHEDWMDAARSPLLPGEPEHRLVLVP